jgi:hypothetical protein
MNLSRRQDYLPARVQMQATLLGFGHNPNALNSVTVRASLGLCTGLSSFVLAHFLLLVLRVVAFRVSLRPHLYPNSNALTIATHDTLLMSCIVPNSDVAY